MTKSEQIALAELGTSPEALAAKTTEMEALTSAGIICPQCHAAPQRTGKNRLSDCGHMRWTQNGWAAKQRSDAGKPKPKKAAAGTLTKEQAAEINFLYLELERAKDAQRKADEFRAETDKNLRAYFATLIAK